MRIIQRYILKEILLTWLAVALVLLAIVTSNRFVNYLADAATGEIPPDVIFTLLGLKLVGYFGQLAPFSFFIGILLTFGRLSRDSEMAALGACGVGGWQLYKMSALLVIPLTLFIAWVSLVASPWAANRAYEVESTAKSTAEISGVRPGRFQESQFGNRVFLVDRLSDDRSEMENIFIEERSYDGDREQLKHVSAQTAYQKYDIESGRRFLVMEDGYRYEGVPGIGDFRVVQFARQTILIEKNKNAGPIKRKSDAYPTMQLLGSDFLGDKTELHWRIAAPISFALLAMFGIALSKSRPREGRYARLIFGVIIFTIYANLQIVGRSILDQGRVPVEFGIWWVHLLILISLIGFLAQQKMFIRFPSNLSKKARAS